MIACNLYYVIYAKGVPCYWATSQYWHERCKELKICGTSTEVSIGAKGDKKDGSTTRGFERTFGEEIPHTPAA